VLRCLLLLALVPYAGTAAQDEPPENTHADIYLTRARQAVVDSSESLASFSCDKHIERWHRDAADAPWHRKDAIDAEVVFDRSTGERYRNVRVNGSPTANRMLELGGSNSLGEFALDLQNLFHSIGSDSFHLARIETHGRQSIRIYTYEVEQASSNWKVQEDSHSVIPAFGGTLSIDAQSGQVVRLEMRARNLPPQFPQPMVSDNVDYGPVTIGSQKARYLPIGGEVLFCSANGACNRNVLRFDNYRQFTAESTVTFAPVTTSVPPVGLPPAASISIPTPWNPAAIHFVGVAHPRTSTELSLELEDERFVYVDLQAPASFPIHEGDRIQVSTVEYDGRGLLAESVSEIVRASSTPQLKTPSEATAAETQDPLVEQARQTEADLLRTLPNYLCAENVKRFQNWPGSPGWELLDRLSADVLYRNSFGETYRNVRINGRPTPRKWDQIGGDISTGEFGTMLRSLLTPGTAKFQFVKDTRIRGLPAAEYTFAVTRAHSDLHVRVDYQYIVPAYSGRIWLHRGSGRVLRLERRVDDIPLQFPIRNVSDKVNFGEIRLQPSHVDLLPVRAETVLCMRKSKSCSRKIINFSDYRLFTADSKLKF
jgi:hypothetical protein